MPLWQVERSEILSETIHSVKVLCKKCTLLWFGKNDWICESRPSIIVSRRFGAGMKYGSTTYNSTAGTLLQSSPSDLVTLETYDLCEKTVFISRFECTARGPKLLFTEIIFRVFRIFSIAFQVSFWINAFDKITITILKLIRETNKHS